MSNTPLPIHTLALAALLCGSIMGAARGDLVFIEYWDLGAVNPTTNGGPLWTGVIDTVTNNLRIDTWTELPGHSAEFWIPTGLPIVWNARDANGNEYDVPDDFGTTVVTSHSNPDVAPFLPYTTAKIDNNFAFISPVPANEMTWKDIDGNPKTFGTIYPPTRVGWGGYAQIETLGGPYVFHTAAVLAEPPYNEAIMPRLPVSSSATISSLDALVRVDPDRRVVTGAGIIIAVPEASVVTFGAIACTACAIGAWIRRRVSRKKSE